MDTTPVTIVAGCAFPEGVRWHNGEVWFVDMGKHVVCAATPDGDVREVVELDDIPTAVDFGPDGSTFVSSRSQMKILSIEGGELVTYADLSDLPWDFLNDMLIDAEGRIYVGLRRTGDMNEIRRRAPDSVALVRGPRDIEVLDPSLAGTNGLALLEDGKRLVVAETYAARLTAFDVAADGSLSGRHVFAEKAGMYPDGICADGNGAIWVASLYSDECLRIAEGGGVVERLSVGAPTACAITGERGEKLVISCADPRAVPPADGTRRAATALSASLDEGAIVSVAIHPFPIAPRPGAPLSIIPDRRTFASCDEPRQSPGVDAGGVFGTPAVAEQQISAERRL